MNTASSSSHHVITTIAELVEQADGKKDIKLKFLNRLEEGKVTRVENPISHVCVYFAAYDPQAHKVFIGHHRKSGLWLFNGGHMDPNETPADTVVREAKEEWGETLVTSDVPPTQLVTLTEIEHPERQVCEWHYDLWCFLPFREQTFHPGEQLLLKEFMQAGWKTYEEAQRLLVDPASCEALDYLRNLM